VFLPRERRIPVFYGENDTIEAEEWGEEVRRFVAARHMTDADAVDYAISHLEGPARREIIRRGRDATLEEVTRVVVDEFGDHRSTGAVRDAFFSCRQKTNENVREYASRLTGLRRRLALKMGGDSDISPRALSERFVEGLKRGAIRTQLQKDLLAARIEAEFEQLRSTAIQWELVEEEDASNTAHTAQVEAKLSVETKVDNLASGLARLEAQLAALHYPKPTERTICQYCQKNGHTAVECRKRLRELRQFPLSSAGQQQAGLMQPVAKHRPQSCYNCHQLDHFARNCPYRPALQRNSPTTAPVPPPRSGRQGNDLIPQ